VTYIAPREKVFAHLDRLAAWKAGDRPAPVTLEWDLSNRCVLGCRDCHFAYTHVRGPWMAKDRALPMAHDKGGDLAFADVVMRTLTDVKRFGVKSIVWTGGGEPTTHPSWQAIVDHAHGVGLEQGMYTLGGLLTRESGRFLAERAAWVVVSLDAPDAATYAAEKGVPPSRFDAALQGIDALVGHKAAVGVSFLLHEGNWFRADEMLALSRLLGATYATFRPTIRTAPRDQSKCVDDRSWITEALPTLERLALEADVEVDPHRFVQYRDWQSHTYSACYGIRMSATITPDARVWVCPNRREFEGSCLGDLKKESFASIWARHPGSWTDFTDCRVMCRLHAVNESLSAVFQPRRHEAFI
jgi:MoaA/NifB/PqqE/SkfB family radical SAM enzyme